MFKGGSEKITLKVKYEGLNKGNDEKSRKVWNNGTVAIIANPVHISHPAAVSPYRLWAGECQHGKRFLARKIKLNLRILIVKPVSHSHTKFMYPKFDAKSLQSLQSHQVSIF